MDEINNIKAIEQKANRTAYQDGLILVVLGLFLFLYAGFCDHIISGFKSNFKGYIFFWIFAFSGQAIHAIRKKITYPRIGYANIPEKISKAYAFTVILPLILFPVALIAGQRFIDDPVIFDRFIQWSPALCGFIIAALLYNFNTKTGLVFYNIAAGIIFLFGLILSLMDFLSADTGINLFFAGTGLGSLVSGFIMLLLFLSKNSRISGQNTSMEQ